jgi:GNAT superfamily N-acetyltransferase
MSQVTRRAQGPDVDRLVPLVRTYWEFERIGSFDAHRIGQLLEELIRSPDRGTIWIADLNGTAVAYLICVYAFSLEHGGMIAEIDEFFVAASHRTTGIGSDLLRAAEQAMRQIRVARIQLQLSRDNIAARRFYQRHGYHPRPFDLLDKIP